MKAIGEGPLLGLDVGERRIGIAICDPLHRLARPLRVLVRRSRAEDFAAIAELAREFQAQAIVVGQPLNMDGSRGSQTRRVERFARHMAEATGLPVFLQDERLSTEVATNRMKEVYGPHYYRRAPLDAYAAAIILQDYLDRVSGAISLVQSPKKTEKR
jgi:putative Holliday junction resolvase